MGGARAKSTLCIRLTEYYRGRAPFNYLPARGVAKPVYSGDLSLAAALETCRARGIPAGRKSNAEVIKLIWAAAQGRNFKYYDLTPRMFPIRRDLSVPVDALFFFVEGGKVKIFWLQPRRGFNPSDEGLGLPAEMVRQMYRADFDDFELELLDLSVPADEAQHRSRRLGFGDLPAVSDKDLEAAAQHFADAYDIVRQMEIKRPERQRRERPSDTRDLFDPQPD
jgi:hypothetical protein